MEGGGGLKFLTIIFTNQLTVQNIAQFLSEQKVAYNRLTHSCLLVRQPGFQGHEKIYLIKFYLWKFRSYGLLSKVVWFYLFLLCNKHLIPPPLTVFPPPINSDDSDVIVKNNYSFSRTQLYNNFPLILYFFIFNYIIF